MIGLGFAFGNALGFFLVFGVRPHAEVLPLLRAERFHGARLC